MDNETLPLETVTDGSAAPQRTSGRLDVAFRRRRGQTVLDRLYQEGAAKGRLPRDHGRGCPDLAIINLAGGLTGGDVMDTAITWGQGTVAGATTQAAEKIYRAEAGSVAVTTRLRVGPGAWAEWLPQETILFERSALDRRLCVEVAGGGRLLAVEPLVFGRLAMGETLARATLRDRIEVHVDGHLAWLDATRLEPPMDVALDAPFRGGGARALATVLYVAPEAEERSDVVRELARAQGVAAGVTCLGPVLLARLHDASPLALRRALVHFLTRLRARLGDLPPRLPRLWQS